MLPSAPRRTAFQRAFTLLELLVVIGIIALLATLGVGALRGFTAVNVVQAGNRQLLDDINRARASAQNQRSTVYMVFVPPLNTFPVGVVPSNQRKYLTNRWPGQLTSYNFITMRSPGDQPGRGRAQYLSEWKTLPQGVFINTNKFVDLPANAWLAAASLAQTTNFPMLPFSYVKLPFPTTTSALVDMPCIAFNYRGALVGPDAEKPRQIDEILSLTRGSLILPRGNNEVPKLTDPLETIETPRGNSTNNPYIRIDWITGRARLEGA